MLVVAVCEKRKEEQEAEGETEKTSKKTAICQTWLLRGAKTARPSQRLPSSKGLVPLLRLVATALCFSAVGTDSPPTDGPALHQPELIDPIHQLPAADDLVAVHRGEGGRGLLATIGASPSDAAEDAISDAGIPALMDASHQSAAREGPAAAAAATAAAAPAAAAATAAAPQRRWGLTDYTGRPLNETSAALDQRCQQAINEVLEREATQTGPPLYSDPLQGSRRGTRP